MSSETKNILMKSGGLIVAGGTIMSMYGASVLFLSEEKKDSTKTAVIGALLILAGVGLFRYSIKQ